MRSPCAVLLTVAVLVTSCVSYNRSEYYAPIGPGRIMPDGFSVPRVLRVDLSSSTSISLSVSIPPNPRFKAYIKVGATDSLKLSSTAIKYVCGVGASRQIALESTLPAVSPQSSPLNSLFLSDGVRSGEYWLDAVLPECLQQAIAITTPDLAIAGKEVKGIEVWFERRSGRFLNSVEVM
jgi:hypothetical protein